MRGKDGKYLQGAALHSALAARCRAKYFLRYPEQSAALANASAEDRALINQVALDVGARLIRRAQFWNQCAKPAIGAIGGTSAMTFLTLLVRPQWITLGASLALILNASIATICIVEKPEDL